MAIEPCAALLRAPPVRLALQRNVSNSQHDATDLMALEHTKDSGFPYSLSLRSGSGSSGTFTANYI